MGKMKLRPIAQALQNAGRGGDTILAHISPAEAALLKSRGGSGTINPETGLVEYGFFGNILRLIAVVAIVIFAPETAAAIGGEAATAGAVDLATGEVLGANGLWASEVAAAAAGDVAVATTAETVLNSGASLIEDSLAGQAIDVSSYLTNMDAGLAGLEGGVAPNLAGEVASLTGAETAATQVGQQGVVQSLGAPTSMAVQSTPLMVADTGITGLGATGSATSIPWYQTVLETIKANPLPSAIAAQGILGGVGQIGAAAAREKEVAMQTQMPEIQRQAAENAMAGAGRTVNAAPAASLMPQEWINAGSIVPRDPVTGVPLGPNLPQAGLLNTTALRRA